MSSVAIKPNFPSLDVDPAAFITLESSDGHRFIVHAECAKASKLISGYLNLNQHDAPPLKGFDAKGATVNEERTHIHFSNINQQLLEMAVRYFYYKYKYDNDPDVRPEFVVDKSMALDLIRVATLLRC